MRERGLKMQDITLDRKEHVAAVFGRAAPTYDQLGQFAFFGRRLVEATHLTPGAQVLDVAAGRGGPRFPAPGGGGPESHGVGLYISGALGGTPPARNQRPPLSPPRLTTCAVRE